MPLMQGAIQMSKNLLGLLASLFFIFFIGVLVIPYCQINLGIVVPGSFGEALWESRSLDVLLQVLIVLAGSLGILVLVKTPPGRDNKP
jgi:hypothetical protein